MQTPFLKGPMDQRHRSAARRGFTLIELLAVILIISILVTALTPMINDAIESSRVTACSANLRQIYNGMLVYETNFKRIPDQSGVRFFASLIAKGAMEKTKPNCERLTCPAIDKSALAIGTMDWEDWWSDLERIDGTYSAYAGRDLKNHPLRKGIHGSGREPLVGDDNDPELNHRTTTNVLYADGSVQTFEFVELQEQGTVTPDETTLVVGPDSPVPDLQKLTLD
jgi:prepilin-type N-terminal cleavage/methylation domain-containing protein/prepilin-type processing-associated H-X9-DG protein